MAVLDLDNAPSWWRRTKNENMTAAEARRLAGTAGGALRWPQTACSTGALVFLSSSEVGLRMSHAAWEMDGT